ncbi:class I SAM-dependent methyltransferase [Kangiella marina]|uniref:Methyltransferase domain-containing protein n=1 Tax=Kangiella marina TaxID=1079178 RepID=A0ABP8ILE9_9GAMM
MPLLQELPEKHIFQAYGILLLENNHRFVKKLKQHYTPSIHGHKTWNSSFLLMDYFLHNETLEYEQTIMELGCGWGPASIFCAQHATAKVTGVDRDDEVFPFLEVQSALNEVEVKTQKASFEKLTKKDLADYDMLIGADICFWDKLTKIHFNLIKRAFQAGVREVVIADPGREPFYELAELCLDYFDDCELIDWYSTEPEHFEGDILHITNTKKPA